MADDNQQPPGQPLPVCDYTTESDAPCEEPAQARRWSGVAVIVAAAFGAVFGGVLVTAALLWALGVLPGSRPLISTTREPAAAVQSGELTITPAAGNVDIAEAVAAKVVPSVVSVKVQQTLINRFTGETADQTVGDGSGVVVRDGGYILTNYHVVEGADKVLVTIGLKDQQATVVGADKSTDLAVLKVNSSEVTPIPIGSSKDLRVGQFVMAVGSPFGLEKTVTSGIVSALQRSESVQQGSYDLTTYTNLIQTDAAINPGNSGGALVDEQGRLVGINTLIQSATSGVGAAQSAGIGFAIPIDFAIDIADQLISTGSASHPYLGVSTQTIDRSIAQQYGLNVDAGALIAFVQPNGPAEKAGLKRGDIITKIGGSDVSGVEDMFAAIREHKIGDTVDVVIVRNETTKTLSVTFGSDASGK